MSTNISKALKIKNRLAGELVKIQTILRRENSRRNDSTSTVDQAQVLNELGRVRTNLVNIKAAITVASVGIATELSALAELKSHINYLAGLNTRDGEEKSAVGYGSETITYTWTAFIKEQQQDALIKEAQILADQLQDKIDDYNASTSVDYTEITA